LKTRADPSSGEPIDEVYHVRTLPAAAHRFVADQRLAGAAQLRGEHDGRKSVARADAVDHRADAFVLVEQGKLLERAQVRKLQAEQTHGSDRVFARASISLTTGYSSSSELVGDTVRERVIV
jgi:hypothetical protein